MKKRQGFTLLELLIVVVILGVLALIATPALLNAADQAKEGASKGNIAVAASSVTSQFALNTTDTPDQIAQKVIDSLNTSSKNPVDPDADAFGAAAAPGIVTLVGGTIPNPNDPAKTIDIITLTAYDKESNPINTKIVQAPAGT